MSLPKNIHLLTLEPWHENEILVRFEHILEKDEDPEYSKFVQFNLMDVLHGFRITNVRETTLDGNAWLDENRRMEFVPDPEEAWYENYAVYAKSANHVQLLKAQKPLVSTDYHEELLPIGNLGAESNRLRRSSNEHKELNRLRMEKLKHLQLSVAELPLQYNDDRKFMIELGPMEIRTFVLYL